MYLSYPPIRTHYFSPVQVFLTFLVFIIFILFYGDLLQYF